MTFAMDNETWTDKESDNMLLGDDKSDVINHWWILRIYEHISLW